MSIGMPNLIIEFKAAARTVVSRSKQGIVAALVRDASVKEISTRTIRRASEIPATLGQGNIDYLSRLFVGSQLGSPSQVVLVLLPPEVDEETEYFAAALERLALHSADYVVGPLDMTQEERTGLKTWVAAQRDKHRTYKAVLPHLPANHMGIVNCVMDETETANSILEASDMCPRIAGVLAGIPLECSATSCVLEEVLSVPTYADEDAMVGEGKLFLTHDGTKARISRAVNSLTTLPAGGGESWKKIKVVEAMDLITYFIRATTEDAYRGKRANSYNNKMLLVSAILIFLQDLEAAGVLQAGKSTVGIDVDAQEAWLKEQGVDTSQMSEQEIREANTGSWVFLAVSVSILDAMEDFTIAVGM